MYVKVPTGIKGVVARAGDRPFRPLGRTCAVNLPTPLQGRGSARRARRLGHADGGV